MKFTTTFLIIIIAACTLSAESRWHKVWKWSIVALTTGATMDISSSIGQYEANPIVRQPNGLFSPKRGIAIKAGICTGLILLGKKYKREGTAANFVAGGVWSGVAIRNWKVRSK